MSTVEASAARLPYVKHGCGARVILMQRTRADYHFWIPQPECPNFGAPARPAAAPRAQVLGALYEHGQAVKTAAVGGWQTLKLILPAAPSLAGVFSLYVQRGGLPTPSDPRTLSFPVLSFNWARP
jgi:hypothetical protein